jgi:hypothetical protein
MHTPPHTTWERRRWFVRIARVRIGGSAPHATERRIIKSPCPTG